MKLQAEAENCIVSFRQTSVCYGDCRKYSYGNHLITYTGVSLERANTITLASALLFSMVPATLLTELIVSWLPATQIILAGTSL